MDYLFSEISEAGKLPETPNTKMVLASALCDWGCVIAGAKPPENFGRGMAAVGAFLGVSPTPSGLMELAKKIK